MNDPRRRSLLAALAALPACAGPMAPGSDGPSGPLPAPVVRVGDRWQYRLTEALRGTWLDEPSCEVAAIGDGIRTLTRGRRGAPPVEELFAFAWAAQIESLHGVNYRFDEPVPLVPAPLQAGTSLRTTTSASVPDTPRRLRWSQRLSVGGWRVVDVPAGRFDCLRIDRLIAYDAPDPFRRNATRSDTLWYAPQVSRWVRREMLGEYVSAGLGLGNPAEGVLAREDALIWELVAYRPAAG
jgi:hypothetical protein